MPRISYTPQSFPPSYGRKLQSPHILTCSWSRLLWSAITVGRASWNKVIHHGLYSAFEIMYRGSMLYANLKESARRKLARSPAYTDLDPTEKSAVSYFLGLTIAKLFAERLLRTPWLLHLDVYKDLLHPSLVGSSRPDLVGINNASEWIVIEVKGRTRTVNSVDKSKAKDQTNQLTHINGVVPALKVGLIAYFNTGDKLEVFLKDPPIDQNRPSYYLDEGDYFYNYYRMFVDFIDSQYNVTSNIVEGNRHYYMKYVSEIDAEICIDREIYGLVKEVEGYRERLLIIPRILANGSIGDKKNYSVPDDSEDDRVAVGNDGICVRLGSSWRLKQQQHHLHW